MSQGLFQFSSDYLNLKGEKLPPLKSWNPEFSGDIDIRIDLKGVWHHEGEIIQREKLVRLFSSILIKEGEEFFLITPVEKWRITVEREPFIIVKADWKKEEGVLQDTLILTSNMGESFIADAEHLLENNLSYPRVQVRDGLYATLSHSVYYALMNSVECVEQENSEEHVYGLYSGDVFHELHRD